MAKLRQPMEPRRQAIFPYKGVVGMNYELRLVFIQEQRLSRCKELIVTALLLVITCNRLL